MSESSHSLGQPSKIGGWTAFGRSTKTPSPSPDISSMARSDSSPIRGPTPEPTDSHTNSPKSQGDAEPAQASASDSTRSQDDQKQKDERLLTGNPKFLSGYALLDLAERYSTSDIAHLANKACGTEKFCYNSINSRLSTAKARKAKALGKTKDEISEELTEKRKANGIRCTRQHSAKKSASASPEGVLDSEDESPVPDQNSSQKAETAQHAARAADPRILSDADARTKYGADYFVFQQPNELYREVLLDLATRYSNRGITEGIAAMQHNKVLTETGVANRIVKALKERAQATGQTPDQVRTALNLAREHNGVTKPNPRGKGYLRTSNGSADGKDSVSEPAEEHEDESKMEQVDDEMTEVGSDADAEQQDAEMTDADSEVQEAEATTAQLETASPDVLEAAGILMGLHEADAKLAASSEEPRENLAEKQEDVEMSEAEAADMAARFRGANGERLCS